MDRKKIKHFVDYVLDNYDFVGINVDRDKLIDEELSINSYKVEVGKYKATIYFEKVETEEEKTLKEKQINDLRKSIERRKNLLANENYVNKAPAHIVELDRQNLLREENELKMLLEK